MGNKCIKIIDNGQRILVRLCSDPNECVIIDFYKLADYIKTLMTKDNRKLNIISMTYYFEENEHDLITDYFGKKITLNDFSIENIIDIEDTFEEYLDKVYCKNLK